MIFSAILPFASFRGALRPCLPPPVAGAAGTRRVFAGALLVFSCFAPACFALKTETLFIAAPSGAVSGQKRNTVEVASGRLFLRFKPGIGAETRRGALASAGFRLLKESGFNGWTLAGLPEGMAVATGLALAKNIAGVEKAGADHAHRIKATPKPNPNDTLLSSQYALTKTGALLAWSSYYEAGSSGTVTVAVLDTGIDGTHPDLSGKLAGQSRFFDPNLASTQPVNQPPTPACNHATRAAGVAAASTDNGIGIAGMSWGAQLLSLKVFDDNDCSDDCLDGTCTTADSTISDAISYAITQHNQPGIGKVIVNMSLGSPYACDSDGTALQDAINSAYGAGLLLVAASGNESHYVDSPAICANVIPVGATNEGDSLAFFSNYGPEMTQRGLTAPGENLYTTTLYAGYTQASGTSFAAPMVSGLAALVWSARPELTNAQVWNVLKETSDDLGMPGADQYFGFGRINAFNAVHRAVEGTFSDFQGKYKAYAYPNPFRPKTDHFVTFTVPDSLAGGSPEIKIYTQEGELVKKLPSFMWDGRNEVGYSAASGVYIFYLKTSRGSAKGKFALIR